MRKADVVTGMDGRSNGMTEVEENTDDIERQGFESTIADQQGQTTVTVPLTTSCVACKRYGKGYEDCVSYSWLWGGKYRNKEFIDRYVFHKPVVETEPMRNGTAAHKILADSRGVITDLNQIVASIVSKKRTIWSGFVCQTSKGVRGNPDAIVSQLTETPDGYLLEHFILEDKTFPKGDYSYLPQVWAEAETLTDPNFLFHISTETLQDRLEGPSVVFYDVLSQLLRLEETGKVVHVNVYTSLNFYGGDPKAPKDGVMWIVKGEPRPADNSIRAPELWSRDFRALDTSKSVIVMRQKKSRIGALKDVRFNKEARQLRFTSRPRKNIKVVDTFPTQGGGVMGLYSPKTADDRREENRIVRVVQKQMADLANFAKVQEEERKAKVVEELAQPVPLTDGSQATA